MRAMTASTIVALGVVAATMGLVVVVANAQEQAVTGAIVLAVVAARFVLWGAAIFALAYFGARLAIRHERRTTG